MSQFKRNAKISLTPLTQSDGPAGCTWVNELQGILNEVEGAAESCNESGAYMQSMPLNKVVSLYEKAQQAMLLLPLLHTGDITGERIHYCKVKSAIDILWHAAHNLPFANQHGAAPPTITDLKANAHNLRNEAAMAHKCISAFMQTNNVNKLFPAAKTIGRMCSFTLLCSVFKEETRFEGSDCNGDAVEKLSTEIALLACALQNRFRGTVWKPDASNKY